MTAYKANTLNSPGSSQILTSDIVTVATAITLTPGKDYGDKRNASVGVEFFSDALGTPTTSGEGTVTVTVSSNENPQSTETISGASITAANPKAVQWTYSTREVIATPASITVATHWRVNLILSEN